VPAPWNAGSDMQADVRRQERLAAARPTEHRPYAMSRKDALDHPQAIQHRPLCGVGGFPPEAVAIVAMSMTAHLGLFVHGLVLSDVDLVIESGTATRLRPPPLLLQSLREPVQMIAGFPVFEVVAH